MYQLHTKTSQRLTLDKYVTEEFQKSQSLVEDISSDYKFLLVIVNAFSVATEKVLHET